MNQKARPLRNLEIGSRKRALEIFRGPLPSQRSARKDDCLSAKREFRLCSEAKGRRVEKCPARGGITIFKGLKASDQEWQQLQAYEAVLRKNFPGIVFTGCGGGLRLKKL